MLGGASWAQRVGPDRIVTPKTRLSHGRASAEAVVWVFMSWLGLFSPLASWEKQQAEKTLKHEVDVGKIVRAHRADGSTAPVILAHSSYFSDARLLMSKRMKLLL